MAPLLEAFRVERLAAITSPFPQIGGWATGGAVSRIDPGRRLARPVALKDCYDPDNLFRMNVNIPPSRGS